jgi:D-alanyl-D-alanine carboxypeptidase/D-alanyl-D-alanine-endopeptidase (penicillin-binding protein 4)
MPSLRSHLFVAVLVATSWLGAGSAQARSSTGAEPGIQARKRSRATAKRKLTPVKRRARTATESQSPRRLPQLPERARGPVGNVAPPGETELERRLQRQLDELMDSRWLKTGINGVHVRDVATGRVLYAYGDDRQLNVASNVKLVATAAALDKLGSDFAYETHVDGPDPDDDGLVAGDVRLRGNWDPTLGWKAIAELAQSLADRGVRRIGGDLLVSTGDRDAVASPRVAIDIVAGPTDGDLPAVTLTPDAAIFVVETSAETKRKARKPKLEVDARWVAGSEPGMDRFVLSIDGQMKPGERVRVVRHVPRGALYTAHVLRSELLLRGITIDGEVRQLADDDTESSVLASHRSAPLRVLAARINKPSDNYLADRVIMSVGGVVRDGDPTMDGGVDAMGDWLAKIGIRAGSYRLENGSGLSYTSHMSARQIVEVLLAAAHDPVIGEDFLHSLSVGGVDGTLRSRFNGRPSKGLVRGKTGTLTGVSALSGFVEIAPGQTVVFSLLANNFGNRRKLSIRAAHADIVDALHGYLVARAGRARPVPEVMTPEAAPSEEEEEEAPAAPEAEPAPAP